MKEELRDLREQYERIQLPLQPYLEKYGEDISLDMEYDADQDVLESLREQEESVTKALERLLSVRKLWNSRKQTGRL